MYNNISTSTKLQYADIACYLSANDYEQNRYYNWVDERKRVRTIYIFKKTLKYFQTAYSTTSAYQNTLGYLYSLIGNWVGQASVVSGTPGGTIPTIAGLVVAGYTPYPLNIIVAPSQAGSHTISAVNASDWQGLVLFTECTINQSVYQLGSDFTYNSTTGVFDFSLSGYTFQTGDKFSCNAYKNTSTIQSTSNSSLNIQTERIQFIIGQPGSPLNNGDTSYTITDSNIIKNSLNVSLDGQGSLPIGTFTDRVALTAVAYSDTGVVMVFNQGVITGQLYIVSYLKYVSV
jgi:hypothetical protein